MIYARISNGRPTPSDKQRVSHLACLDLSLFLSDHRSISNWSAGYQRLLVKLSVRFTYSFFVFFPSDNSPFYESIFLTHSIFGTIFFLFFFMLFYFRRLFAYYYYLWLSVCIPFESQPPQSDILQWQKRNGNLMRKVIIWSPADCRLSTTASTMATNADDECLSLIHAVRVNDEFLWIMGSNKFARNNVDYRFFSSRRCCCQMSFDKRRSNQNPRWKLHFYSPFVSTIYKRNLCAMFDIRNVNIYIHFRIELPLAKSNGLPRKLIEIRTLYCI